ncbi:MAG: hypothetical protein A3G40_13890 [Deltaproteobacteria bacterium RIFCSPLOWO2_12_FULL_57_22]|nr:MAG: hypothetical protein A3G40_13890 [Deltaproteobacteria bacterium RIFCSPLOWO2_12_FULL_57_22]
MLTTLQGIAIHGEGMKKIALCNTVVLVAAIFMWPIFQPEAGAAEVKSPVKAPVAFVSASAAFLPLFVAYETGIFRRYQLDVTLQYLAALIATHALMAGDINFVVGGADGIAASRSNPGSIVYVANYLPYHVFSLYSRPEIRSVRELRGKIVGVTTPGAATDPAARLALERNTLTPDKDVKIVYLQSVPAILSALKAGTIAAGILSAPTTLQAQQLGFKELVDIGALKIPALHGGIYTMKKFADQEPLLVVHFLQVMAEGVQQTLQDPASAKKALAVWTKNKDATILDESYRYFAPQFTTEMRVHENQIATMLPFIPESKTLNPSMLIDNQYWEKAKSQGK